MEVRKLKSMSGSEIKFYLHEGCVVRLWLQGFEITDPSVNIRTSPHNLNIYKGCEISNALLNSSTFEFEAPCFKRDVLVLNGAYESYRIIAIDNTIVFVEVIGSDVLSVDCKQGIRFANLDFEVGSPFPSEVYDKNWLFQHGTRLETGLYMKKVEDAR